MTSTSEISKQKDGEVQRSSSAGSPSSGFDDKRVKEIRKRHNQQLPSTATMTEWCDIDYLLGQLPVQPARDEREIEIVERVATMKTPGVHWYARQPRPLQAALSDLIYLELCLHRYKRRVQPAASAPTVYRSRCCDAAVVIETEVRCTNCHMRCWTEPPMTAAASTEAQYEK